MSYDYTTYVSAIANIMAVGSDTPQFQNMLPRMIEYAEQRIYRELDLLNTVNRNDTVSLTTGNRNFTLPSTTNGNYITVQGINVITPANTAADNGTRVALQATTRDYLDMVWNAAGTTALPVYFALIDQFNGIVGPWPNATYRIEVIGTIRPNPLSVTNTTTFLTQYLPDLFLAASMIFASGYQRDFGSQADNPAQAVSWESQYEKLFASANGEELRKKFCGPGWTSLSSIATPPNR